MTLEQIRERFQMERALFLRPRVILVEGTKRHLVVGPELFIKSTGFCLGNFKVNIGGGVQVQEMFGFAIGGRIITEWFEEGTMINGWYLKDLELRPPRN